MSHRKDEIETIENAAVASLLNELLMNISDMPKEKIGDIYNTNEFRKFKEELSQYIRQCSTEAMSELELNQKIEKLKDDISELVIETTREEKRFTTLSHVGLIGVAGAAVLGLLGSTSLVLGVAGTSVLPSLAGYLMKVYKDKAIEKSKDDLLKKIVNSAASV